MCVREFVETLHNERLVAILRESEAAVALELGERLLTAGVRLIEVSLVTPGALDVIAKLVELSRDFPGSLIGAGTVLDVAGVEDAANAGGRFVLSPVFDRGVISAAKDYGLAVVPGCATPTEMFEATRLGADAVKIFPASAWSPASLKDLLQPLPRLRCLPTGGISRECVPDWLKAGAEGIGLGGIMRGLAVAGIRELAAAMRR